MADQDRHYEDGRRRQGPDPRDDDRNYDDQGYRGEDRSFGSGDYGHPDGDAWRGRGRSTARREDMSYGAAWPPAAYDASRFQAGYGAERSGAYRPREYDYDDGYGDRTGVRGSEQRDWWDRAADEARSWFGDEDAQARRDRDEAPSHRGRGPKGYKRSDQRISEDIHDRLTDDRWLDGSDIRVRVDGGEVTLDGQVRSRRDKHRAEELCEDVSGVSHVQNNLRLARRDLDMGDSTSADASPAGRI